MGNSQRYTKLRFKLQIDALVYNIFTCFSTDLKTTNAKNTSDRSAYICVLVPYLT